MGNTSFGGRARCGCRAVPGNVGVGTSPVPECRPQSYAAGRAARAHGAAQGALGFGAAGRSAAGLPS
eukprot:scaffold11741_cov135-Isochrysis_galbana.AAC.2